MLNVLVKQMLSFSGTQEVPTLEDFKQTCAKQMLRCSLFQGEMKDDVDVLSLPLIMAPRLLGMLFAEKQAWL